MARGRVGLTTRVRQRDRKRERTLPLQMRWPRGRTYMWAQAARSCEWEVGSEWEAEELLQWDDRRQGRLKSSHAFVAFVFAALVQTRRRLAMAGERVFSFFAVCFVCLCKWRLLSAAALHVCTRGDYYPVSPVRLLIFMSNRDAFPAVALWEAE